MRIPTDVTPSTLERDSFLLAEHPRLLRSAFLLTGDHHAAADLTQETVVRALVNWKKVARADSPPAYLRRIMLNQFLSNRRRRWIKEATTEPGQLPERPSGDDYDVVDSRLALLALLQRLPPRQRAAVTLRHYEHFSEAETAHLLGCSVGTVKSLTSRGMAELRSLTSSIQEQR